MSKAGITVDDWKLPIFRKQLTEAGFAYEDRGHLMAGVTLLTVETDDVARLNLVLNLCQMECRKKRSH